MQRSLARRISVQGGLTVQRLSASRAASVIYNFPWKNHVSGDLKVKVSEDQTEAEVVLPGFAFGDLNRFGRVTPERAIKKIEEGRLHAASFGKLHSYVP